MGKRSYIKKEVNDIKTKYFNHWFNYFYNMWMASREVEGDFNDEAKNFIMRKFWCDGTIATYNIKILDELGFAPYTIQNYNMYDFPINVMLINNRGVSKELIPDKLMKVDKDVVLGWCCPAHKGIYFFMLPYIERLTQIEMITDNHIALQNIPFLLNMNGTNKEKINDIITRILNGEIVINIDGDVMEDVSLFKTEIQNHLDEFTKFKYNTLNEALMILGVNSTPYEKQERLVVAEAKSNDQQIEMSDDVISDELDKFSGRVKEVLGKTITFISKYDIIEAEAEEQQKEEPQEKDEEGEDDESNN